MKLLFTSYFCPNDCDKKPTETHQYALFRGKKYRFQEFSIEQRIPENYPAWGKYMRIREIRNKKTVPEILSFIEINGTSLTPGYAESDHLSFKSLFEENTARHCSIIIFGEAE